MANKLVIISESGYPMEVHAVGCRDLTNRRKFPRGVQTDWQVDGFEGLREQHEELNHQFDQPYKFEELFRVMPCCGTEVKP